MPWASVAMDHFQPILARSVGFLPVPSPPHGALCDGPVECDFGEIETDDAVIGMQGVLAQGVEHAGRDPFVATGPQRRVGNLGSRGSLRR